MLLLGACSGGQGQAHDSAGEQIAVASADERHAAPSEHESAASGSDVSDAGGHARGSEKGLPADTKKNDTKNDTHNGQSQTTKRLAMPVLLGGVSSVQAPATLAEQFTADVRAIRDRLGFSSIIMLIALVGLAWFSTQLIPWLVRLGYRLGMRHTRLVDNFGMLGRFAIWTWVLMVILLRAWRVAPMITLLAAGLVAAGLMVGLVKHFENLSTGFGLALHGRIKIGDQITVGEHMGMVRHIGLMHIQIRTPEGMVYLPNRLLAGEALLIGRSRNSYPLRARLTASQCWPPEALEVARCIAALSPYRDVNSRVNIQSEADDERVLVVEIQVWSPRLLDAADRHLRSMLEVNLRGMVRDTD